MNDFHKLHQNVQAAIGAAQAKCKVHDHDNMSLEIKSPLDFATALGYQVQRVTKTLFLSSQDERKARKYAVAVCSTDRRLNFESIARAIGVGTIELASAEDLRARTGYPKKGVSPLGLAGDITVIVDSLLLNYPTVLIGGGATGIEIELSPSDLMLISGATLKSVTA